ncbi:MAG: hypothetical protein ABI172_06585 [Ginsengibacter sp.]|jgi:hypothetical protein
MENDEISMNERESMELIISMINKAKNNFSERGILYLAWGWVILFCCITQFVGDHFFHYENTHLVWLLIYAVIIFQIIYLRGKRHIQKAKTYTGDINAFVWITFFICMMIIIFICLRYEKYDLIYPLLLVLYGMPTFLSGFIIKFQPLIIGGICCWILAIISPFINVEYHVLFIGAAVIVAWIIPGYLLKAKFKKQN